MALIADAELKKSLADLPGWRQEGKSLVRQFDMKGFKAAVAFANTVAEIADRADHHPDILIQMGKVTLTLMSHDSGGVTDRDVRLARQIQAAAGDQKA